MRYFARQTVLVLTLLYLFRVASVNAQQSDLGECSLIIGGDSTFVVWGKNGWISFILHRLAVVGDECVVQRTNAPGICRLVSECASVIDDIRNRRGSPTKCGFANKVQVVCCSDGVQQRTTSTSAPMTSTMNNHPRIVESTFIAYDCTCLHCRLDFLKQLKALPWVLFKKFNTKIFFPILLNYVSVILSTCFDQNISRKKPRWEKALPIKNITEFVYYQIFLTTM